MWLLLRRDTHDVSTHNVMGDRIVSDDNHPQPTRALTEGPTSPADLDSVTDNKVGVTQLKQICKPMMPHPAPT